MDCPTRLGKLMPHWDRKNQSPSNDCSLSSVAIDLIYLAKVLD